MNLSDSLTPSLQAFFHLPFGDLGTYLNSSLKGTRTRSGIVAGCPLQKAPGEVFAASICIRITWELPSLPILHHKICLVASIIRQVSKSKCRPNMNLIIKAKQSSICSCGVKYDIFSLLSIFSFKG